MVSPMQRMLDVVRARDYMLRGEMVDYWPKGGLTPYKVLATPTSPQSDVELPGGAIVTTRQMNFIVEVDSLNALPQTGDAIEYAGRRYQVAHPGGGGVYDFHDSYHQSLRIYTIEMPRRVDVAAAYGTQTGVMYGNANGVGYKKPRG